MVAAVRQVARQGGDGPMAGAFQQHRQPGAAQHVRGRRAQHGRAEHLGEAAVEHRQAAVPAEQAQALLHVAQRRLHPRMLLRHLPGMGGGLVGHQRADLRQRGSDAGLHGGQGAQQVRRLPVPGHRDGVVQPPGGDGLGDADGGPHGRGDQPGQHDGDRQSAGQEGGHHRRHLLLLRRNQPANTLAVAVAVAGEGLHRTLERLLQHGIGVGVGVRRRGGDGGGQALRRGLPGGGHGALPGDGEVVDDRRLRLGIHGRVAADRVGEGGEACLRGPQVADAHERLVVDAQRQLPQFPLRPLGIQAQASGQQRQGQAAREHLGAYGHAGTPAMGLSAPPPAAPSSGRCGSARRRCRRW